MNSSKRRAFFVPLTSFALAVALAMATRPAPRLDARQATDVSGLACVDNLQNLSTNVEAFRFRPDFASPALSANGYVKVDTEVDLTAGIGVVGAGYEAWAPIIALSTLNFTVRMSDGSFRPGVWPLPAAPGTDLYRTKYPYGIEQFRYEEFHHRASTREIAAGTALIFRIARANGEGDVNPGNLANRLLQIRVNQRSFVLRTDMRDIPCAQDVIRDVAPVFLNSSHSGSASVVKAD